MTTAFVAGATGYTGREVVRVLRAQGIATVAHVRPDSSRLAGWRTRLAALGATVDATPWEPAALAATLAALKPGIVFALLGTTRERARRAMKERGRDEGYEAVDYGLSVMLLQAAVGCGSTPRFVYLSAAGARDGAASAYLAVRGRVEREVAASGLPYVIARPSFITGPDRDEFRLGERIGANLTDAALALAGLAGASGLRARYRSTTNVALAEALVRLGRATRAPNRVFESEELR
jgi:uncharacterized protein YbjT (DUF2867 family)